MGLGWWLHAAPAPQPAPADARLERLEYLLRLHLANPNVPHPTDDY